MRGASPPTFWRAFPGPRGRPDLKNAPQKIRPDCLQEPNPSASPSQHIHPHRKPFTAAAALVTSMVAPVLMINVDVVIITLFVLLAIKSRDKQNNSNFGLLRPFSGQTWPRDLLQRVRLDKWCRTLLD
jgi:hypothetical protein